MQNRREEWLIETINRIHPGAYELLATIGDLQHDRIVEIIAATVRFSCGQHMGSINSGRKAFSRLPIVSELMLSEGIAKGADLNDEWDYRRVLELLYESKSSLMERYIAIGLESENPKIREAASDFQEKT